MVINANKLATLLRSDARLALDAGLAETCAIFHRLANLVEQASKDDQPAPDVCWFGPFEHHGGECPLPPETEVEAWCRNREPELAKARQFDWGHTRSAADITSFSYASPDPEGWIERPAGWVPPPAEDSDWVDWTPTHIRLVPREAKPAPKPDVVREALEWAIAYERGDPYAETRRKCRAALAALVAAPGPETLPEWAWVDANGLLRIKITNGESWIMWGALNPDDLDRIVTACRIRAAQLRKGTQS